MMTAPEEIEKRFSFDAVRLLVPPVRLMSAAMWKVVKQRDVKRYGVVEEFVSSVCDTVPGLLKLRHRVKLTLGLRARLILDMLSSQVQSSDVELVKEHLQRVHCAAECAKKDSKVMKSVMDFLKLVDSMIGDPKAKDKFFKEVFLQDYGPAFDHKLETLMWEFLVHLDTLLPIPTLSQTAEWLNCAPFVKEVCVSSASQPQLLNVLLQHQVSLGHLDNTDRGDVTLLSLPPSGKSPSDQSTRHARHSLEDCSDTFISPVIGLISNQDVPAMVSAQRMQKSMKTNKSTEVMPRDDGAEMRQRSSKSGGKRKFDHSSSESTDGECNSMIQVSEKNLPAIETLHMPEDPSLHRIFLSCLNKRARVVIRRLSPMTQTAPRAQITSKRLSRTPQKQECSFSDDKENCPVIKEGSHSRLQDNTASTSADEAEDYVADSEDEASKNFKGRLFYKRYYRTKHGTYVPTLREFWKPCTTRPDLSLQHKHRR